MSHCALDGACCSSGQTMRSRAGLRRRYREVAMTTRARRPLVLLVEDSDDSRELIGECLALGGFDVREARDGLEALDEATRAPLPDGVLMGRGLPRLDGV